MLEEQKLKASALIAAVVGGSDACSEALSANSVLNGGMAKWSAGIDNFTRAAGIAEQLKELKELFD